MPHSEAFVQCTSLGMSFDGVSDVLKDVSLDVAQGEIVSIIGRSGSGKSTLLRLIGGLLDATAGTVTIDGRSASKARLAKSMGFMPQAPALLGWRNVERNVGVVHEINKRNDVTSDISESLAAVGLLEHRHKFPDELSGGMQQRVALARAIAVSGNLLLLDEPFVALDELTRDGLYELLLDIWTQTKPTIVFVTHNLDEALLLSDRVVVLGGKPAEVKGVVSIDVERPRRKAIDDGQLAQQLAHVRGLLAE